MTKKLCPVCDALIGASGFHKHMLRHEKEGKARITYIPKKKGHEWKYEKLPTQLEWVAKRNYDD